MRWPAFLLLAYVLIGVQVGVGAFATVRGVGPDLALLAVVFAALHARPAEATFAGLAVGLMQDLVTVQPLGLFAASYGLTAAIVARLAEHVRRSHPLTYVAMTLLGGGITGLLLVAHGIVHPATRVGPRVAVVSAVYTAVLALVVLWPLDRVRRAFGFDSSGGRRRR